MGTNISTKLYYIDYEYILQNYKKEEFWTKKWTIYDYGKLKIELGINAINVRDNKIIMGINIYYAGDKRHQYDSHSFSGINGYCLSDWDSNVIFIPINNKEYTNKIFQNKIYGSCQRLIKDVEYSLINKLAVYKNEKTRIDLLKDHLKDIANDFLDANNVTNEAIREAYVDKYVYDNKDKSSQLNKIVLRFNEKLLTKEYLLFASFNDNEKDVEKFSKILNEDKVSKSSVTVWVQKLKDAKFDWEKLLPAI
jgi:transcriptional regulator NrdR family protein